MKKIAVLLMALTMLLLPVTLCFTSCSGGIDTDKAKEHIISFLTEIKEGDFTEAKTYLHPNFDGDIEKFFNSVEKSFNVDFQNGITILRNTNTQISYYDSKFDGSAYELTMDIEVSGRELEITVNVVENDNGYGVYGIEIDD